jgi:peptidyl-prolyl cis-trans isomerase SurA
MLTMSTFFQRTALCSCLLLPLLTLSPVGAQAQSNRATAPGGNFIVALVDSAPITNLDVQRRAAQLRQQLNAQGRGTSTSAPTSVNLMREALERLIDEKAQLQFAKETGVDVDAAALDQAEQRLAAQSQITVDELHKKAKAEGTSVTQLRQDLRDQLTLQRLAERNVPARIKVSDVEIAQAMQERLAQNANTNPTVELGHILIAVPETASPTQVAALQAKADAALARLKKGESFATVAKDMSDSAERDKGGLMGARPADRYPSLFVDATQKLAVGELSNVVRSGAGFHILKLVSKQGNAVATITETRARHILLRLSSQLSPVAARAQLAGYKRQIEAGKADFAKLAQEHSQDASGPNGGDLGWVAPGMFVPEFEAVMNALKIGEIADPMVSRFGVHLIQVLARREAPITERELRELVRNKLRDSKYEETYQIWAQEMRGRAYVEYRDAPQ